MACQSLWETYLLDIDYLMPLSSFNNRVRCADHPCCAQNQTVRTADPTVWLSVQTPARWYCGAPRQVKWASTIPESNSAGGILNALQRPNRPLGDRDVETAASLMSRRAKIFTL